MSATDATRTWRFSFATRLLLAFLATAMYGFAAVLFWVPFTFGGGGGATWVVAITGIVVFAFGLFASFALVAAVKTRVTLADAMLDATIVAGHDVFLLPRFRKVHLPVSHIRSVERRCEIFRMLGFYSMREALSIVTSHGERIGICSDTIGNAATIPLDAVANAIAASAGIAVTDDGTVRTKGSGLYGAASSSWTEAPLDAVRADKSRRAAVLTLQLCSLILLLTFALRACL